jgi:hypothetical protein
VHVKGRHLGSRLEAGGLDTRLAGDGLGARRRCTSGDSAAATSDSGACSRLLWPEGVEAWLLVATGCNVEAAPPGLLSPAVITADSPAIFEGWIQAREKECWRPG